MKGCLITVKFGRMKKGYEGLDTVNDKYFQEEFKKFWDAETGQETGDFKSHWHVLKYINDHDLPILFENGLTGDEYTLPEVTSYLLQYELPYFKTITEVLDGLVKIYDEYR